MAEHLQDKTLESFIEEMYFYFSAMQTRSSEEEQFLSIVSRLMDRYSLDKTK